MAWVEINAALVEINVALVEINAARFQIRMDWVKICASIGKQGKWVEIIPSWVEIGATSGLRLKCYTNLNPGCMNLNSGTRRISTQAA